MKDPTAPYPVGIASLDLNHKLRQLNPPFLLTSISLNSLRGVSLYLSHRAPMGMPVLFVILRATAPSTFQKAPTYPTALFHQHPHDKTSLSPRLL